MTRWSVQVARLWSLSDDDEVALLAEVVERQMELPAVSEIIPVPSSSSKQEVTRAATPRLTYISGPMFDASNTWEWAEDLLQESQD